MRRRTNSQLRFWSVGKAASHDMPASDRGLTARLLWPRLRRVFLANNGGQAKIREASEYLGSNIRAVLVIAEIFSEHFFASVRSREARFNGYPRDEEPPDSILVLSDGWRALAQVTFVPRYEPVAPGAA